MKRGALTRSWHSIERFCCAFLADGTVADLADEAKDLLTYVIPWSWRMVNGLIFDEAAPTSQPQSVPVRSQV